MSTNGATVATYGPTPKYDYDLIVIGSGPAAVGCAISSSRRGKKVSSLQRILPTTVIVDLPVRLEHLASLKRPRYTVQVAVIDKPGMLGGVCVNTGTIPSKTFREAVLYLTGIGAHDHTAMICTF